MLRHAAAALIAGSLALGPAAAPPARAADASEVAGIIAGIAALAIIGRAIEERRDRRAPAPAPVGRDRYPGFAPDWKGGHGKGFAPVGRGQPLPAACLRSVPTPRGEFRGYGARCLERNFRRAQLLPERCLRRVETFRGPRTLYAQRCLRRAGWREEARFRD